VSSLQSDSSAVMRVPRAWTFATCDQVPSQRSSWEPSVAGCTKIQYPNRWAAACALRSIRKREGSRGRKLPVRIYRCPECRGWWHLTSRR